MKKVDGQVVLSASVAVSINWKNQNALIGSAGDFGPPKWVSRSKVDHIRNLKCYAEVHEMIIGGFTVADVGQFIHDKGELLDMGIDAVKVCVSHYKASIPKGTFLAKKVPQLYSQIEKKVESAVDVFEEMAQLLKIQKERIDLGFAREKQLKIPMGFMHKEIVVAQELLKSLYQMKHNFIVADQRMGSEKQAFIDPTQEADLSAMYTKESVAKVLRDPKKRYKVVDVVERMIDMYGTSQASQQV